MLEIIVTFAAFALDQLTKHLTMTQLVGVPPTPLIGEGLYLFYAQNFGTGGGFLRGRSIVMIVIRLLELAIILYLLIKHRNKLKPITRIALCLFMAGLVGNEINYLISGFVADMFLLPSIGMVFNVADIYVLVAVIILIIRLAFFEGRDLVDWMYAKFSGKKTAAAEKEEVTDETELPEDTGEGGE